MYLCMSLGMYLLLSLLWIKAHLIADVEEVLLVT